MHIEKMGEKITEIAILWNELRENITLKVASKEEQEEMRKRIFSIMQIYEQALEKKVVYVPYVRSELNSILYTLKRWQEYNDIVLCKAFAKVAKRIGKK